MENQTDELLTWKRIDFYLEIDGVKQTYRFEIGSCIHECSNRKLICINKNYLIEKQNANFYFRVDYLNPDKKSVEPLFDIKNGPRYRITPITYNKKLDELYFYGGSILTKDSIILYLNDLWKYKINDNIFENLTNQQFNLKPGPRGGHTLVCYSELNKIYLFGGKITLNSKDKQLNDLYVYDISKLK